MAAAWTIRLSLVAAGSAEPDGCRDGGRPTGRRANDAIRDEAGSRFYREHGADETQVLQ